MIYTCTRPRGLASWAPRRKTVVVLDQVRHILEEYREYLPLTCRQLFYRLVGAHGYGKTENAYARLAEILTRARRAGMIPFDAIRDDGVVCEAPGGFDGLMDFWGTVRYTAAQYTRDLGAGQPVVVEVWSEAAGMVPMLARAAHEYGVPVYSSGGFDSLTSKHDAAQRMANRSRRTVVLHVGDYDASGVAMFDSVADDVAQLVRDLGGRLVPEFIRVAVTKEQIAAFDLPAAPAKATDRRGGWDSDTVQAEALPPNALVAMLRGALDAHVDRDVLEHLRETGQEERRQLLEVLDGLDA